MSLQEKMYLTFILSITVVAHLFIAFVLDFSESSTDAFDKMGSLESAVNRVCFAKASDLQEKSGENKIITRKLSEHIGDPEEKSIAELIKGGSDYVIDSEVNEHTKQFATYMADCKNYLALTN